MGYVPLLTKLSYVPLLSKLSYFPLLSKLSCPLLQELFPLLSKLSFSPQYEQINEIMCMIGNLLVKNIVKKQFLLFLTFMNVISFYCEIVCLYYS